MAPPRYALCRVPRSWPRSLVRGNVTRRQGNCCLPAWLAQGTRALLGVGTRKSCGRDLRMREGRLWWSIGRRAPQQRRVTAPLFWESGTCFFPLHRRRAFNCIPVARKQLIQPGAINADKPREAAHPRPCRTGDTTTVRKDS
ncbi:hypothetical protein ALC62_07964 [Cyphomyrmex costatus]|uniref:Uncharacterized protein n=1 Tax=Cyphomyrmex costatus TaxID=456900 RepID=A0A195CKU2_9HYME|nr:hypothetical protein ALC62_07964 [Cyphomyrmex costatus]